MKYSLNERVLVNFGNQIFAGYVIAQKVVHSRYDVRLDSVSPFTVATDIPEDWIDPDRRRIVIVPNEVPQRLGGLAPNPKTK